MLPAVSLLAMSMLSTYTGENSLQVGNNLVNLPLEGRFGIHEGKWHRNSCFLDVGWVHWNLQVSFS
jgi:hypothetical protein